MFFKPNMKFESSCPEKFIEHKQRIAFHEAGHAVAICLNSKARNLPSIFFQIMLIDLDDKHEEKLMCYKALHDNCIAGVKGGRFIEWLPSSMEALAQETKGHNDAIAFSITDYMAAFEADIINLLAGPIAEAKYIAGTEELFNQHFVDLKALKNYGGCSDLALATEYLQCFSACKQQQTEKLDKLFSAALNFIKNQANWAAITKLAGYILESNKNTISYEEVVSLLENSLKDRSRVVSVNEGTGVFTKRRAVKMPVLRNRGELLQNYVANPLLGLQRLRQDGWGRRRH
jgi:hypothetical protein